jgi:transposase
MPRTCLACSSREREAIDKALVAGESYRNISRHVSISPAALFRHKNHVANAIGKAQAEHEERLSETLVDEMRRVQRKAWELLARTESVGDHRGSIVALREVRECLESLGEMLAKADAVKGGPAQDERMDLSRLNDEQLAQLGALMEVVYGPGSLEDTARRNGATVCDRKLRMTKHTLSISVLVLSVAASALAQVATQPSKQPSIRIGMSLQLGMPRDAIITKLSENYNVTKFQDTGDEWIVAGKNNPENWEGYLGFHGGKLTYANRSWTQGDEDKYAFAQALQGAMSQMDSEGQHSCTFDVPTTHSPAAEIRYVRLYCGPKKIEIMLTNVFNGEGKGQRVSISEVLSSEANR